MALTDEQREKKRASNRRYYLKHREAELARAKAKGSTYRIANKEKFREYNRAYRARHAERLNAAARERYLERADYYREYREKNRERLDEQIKTWRDENRERVRQYGEVATERRRTGANDVAMDYRDTLRADPCSYCHGPAGEIDHITAVAVHPDGSWQNLTAACRSCNARKSAKPMLTFLLDRLAA